VPESYKEDGRPSDQWYWDDWFSSHDVHSCSLAAQGLWINLLGIMFASEVRGTLTVNGIQMDNKAIAKRFGKSITNINKLVMELEEARVFSRLADGTIYSRRMYRRSKKRGKISKIRSKAGKEGMKKRWGKSDKKGNNKKITKITAPTPSPTPSPTSTPKKKTYAQDELEKLFEKWWKRYPRTEDKGKAKSKYFNLVENEEVDPQLLEDALTGYINVLNNNETPKQYVKHAKTFLYNGNKEKKIPSTWEQFVKYADPKYKTAPSL